MDLELGAQMLFHWDRQLSSPEIVFSSRQGKSVRFSEEIQNHTKIIMFFSVPHIHASCKYL
jgi:hypothetical protein